MSGTAPTRDCTARPRWPLERILFLLAGTVTLIGVLLTVTVSRWLLLVPGLVGVNQLLKVATGWCPASLLLTRLGVRGSPTAVQPRR